ncbi:MAG: hypothetical protein HPY53_01135 [Brevinematales bacterium]|nr:hypothetical protein [Brevinematales bacterium]
MKKGTTTKKEYDYKQFLLYLHKDKEEDQRRIKFIEVDNANYNFTATIKHAVDEIFHKKEDILGMISGLEEVLCQKR